MSPVPPPDPTAASPQSEQQALRGALAALLTPLAQLAVARGMPFAEVEEMMKEAFVHAANQAHQDLLPHRRVSRISTATGINRREVTRLTQRHQGTTPPARSLASEVFGHWRTQAPYRGRNGQPRALPRQGPEPSFESLAQSITRDVHPRSLLDELCRLGLANWDETTDVVTLAREAFVPQGDRVHKLALLGDNVGDHFRAAVDNVLKSDFAHHEQALFADGLSPASLLHVRTDIKTQWQALMSALIPSLEARIAADAELPVAEDAPLWRVRVGLYSYQEPVRQTANDSSTHTTAEGAAVANNKPEARRTAARKRPRKP